MTFCFSFEVFITLNPIQVNMKRGGPTYYYKAKRRDESRVLYCTVKTNVYQNLIKLVFSLI